MRPGLGGVIALALFGLLMPAAAHADPYRWCAQYSERGGGGAENCGFVTLRQCEATISGIGGFCMPNLNYTGPDGYNVGWAAPRRHHRIRYDHER
jgi:Protein of unknown function (DUF3551)